MSLITRCPACGTMFKVVPDQLRISEGWVRCGHCAEVFDASANLQEAAPPIEVAPASPEAGAGPATGPTEPGALTAQPADLSQAAPSQPRSPHDYSESTLGEGAEYVVAQAADSVFRDEATPPVPPEPDPRLADLDAKDSLIDKTNTAMYPPFEESYDSSQYPSSMLPEEHENVPFIRTARRKALWRRPAVRGALAFAGLVLFIGLAFQVAVHERDRIAAWDPRTRPWIEQLCSHAGCQLSPLRQIESLVIDGSSFSKVRGDAYRLGITLRNTATLPLALPAIELALTDTQDQPVIRRVLLPSELGATTGMLEAGGEWSGNFTLAVSANGSSGRIAGYRLLAFYP
ncbi:MAG: DUF3426 domain-containing protein [Burkholderiaceae bacterium]